MVERHDEVSFEPRDVKVAPIFGSLGLLAIALAAAMLGLWWMQSQFLQPHHEQALELPPEPRIEGVGLDRATHSVTNLDLPTSARSQRLHEDQMLRDGWTDSGGKKHPPIADAIKQLLQKERPR